MEKTGSLVEILWQEETLQLLPQKAIYWPREETLFVADPHFGKSASFRKHGIPVSEKTTEDDCMRLEQILKHTHASRLIFLGDFFHARQSKTQVLRNLLFLWREEFPDLEIHLIRGNHDLKAGDPWAELKIKCHDEPWPLAKWDCRHHPVESAEKPFFAGHLHPGFTLNGQGKSRLRSPCFQINQDRIIFPAFGLFTGLKNIVPAPGDGIFLTNGKEIVGLPTNNSFLK